jgi:large subunit ribosomal protein L3
MFIEFRSQKIGDMEVPIGLIGKKIGMTQIFSSDGEVIPVTVVEAGPCAVVQKKTVERDGYSALQLSFSERKLEKLTKPLQGHFKKLNGKAYSVLKEFRIKETDKYEVGDQITLDIFEIEEKVAVSGISSGKGFAGVIKRWSFSRGPMSHGSKLHRGLGSTGMSAFPGKVLKGKKMPGHMGSKRLKVRSLEIVDKKEQENIIFIKGAIPGGKNGIITIHKLKD